MGNGFTLAVRQRVLAGGLKRLARRYPRAAAGALYREAENVMADAKENYVPVDLGALRSSGFVERPTVEGGVTVTLGFGGPSAGYAVIVHEDLTKNHDVGQAKYLEDPLNQALPGMIRRIRDEVARETRRGGSR